MKGRPLLLPLLAATLALASPAPAAPLVVDRVVAIVDDGIILLSELRDRSRPFKLRLDEAKLPPDKRAAAEAQLRDELLTKLIEERLIAGEAERARIEVSAEEVTQAVDSVAAQASTTREGILALAAKQGLNEAEYRAELRRQVLEGKLIYRKIPAAERKPAGLTAEAIERRRGEIVASLKARAFIEVRLEVRR